MAVKLGTTSLGALYLGSTAISTAYLGSVQVYDAGGAFTPASLFASGEEGAWYEPSTTTCFTDTAGTIAATYGDAVARINDLSGNGNHATQATAAARPILARVPATGRRNLATTTELDNTLVWTQDGLSSLTGGQTDPSGGTDAFLLTEDTNSSAHRIYLSRQYASGAVTVQVKAKAVNRRYINFNLASFSSGSTIVYDLQTASVSAQNGAVVSSNASDLGDGWVLCTATVNVTNTSAGRSLVIGGNDGSAYDDVYVGSGTDAFYLSGFQLEEGSTATAYQKVVDQYDITEAGVTSLDYLSFDGTDDFMQSAATGWADTQTAWISAGVSCSDASETRCVVLGVSDGDYSFGEVGLLDVQSPAGNRWSFGNASGSIDSIGDTSPDITARNVLTGFSDGTDAKLRRNGAEVATASTAVSSATISLNQEIDLGFLDNAGTGVAFSPLNLFGVIVRLDPPDAGELSNTETYLANRSGVTL